MPRRPGRPRTEQTAMDKKLSRRGGLRAVVGRLDREELTLAQMIDELERLTEVRIAESTLSTWMKEWREEDGSAELQPA